MKIDIIAGARPNFMKIAPIIDALKVLPKKDNINYRLIHTGQHYDKKMSESFFSQLNIPKPTHNLNAGSGTHANQTSKIMIAYEAILFKSNCDLCIVVGDVNSTMACSIVAKKMGAKVAHVEGGIRSFDILMPEEINRMVTDSITDYFFTTSKIANKNLTNLGVPRDKIFFVGNTMVDTLLKNRSRFIKPKIWDKISLKDHNYIILTMHRPSNVNSSNKFRKIINQILICSKNLPIIFPVHPRIGNQINLINNLGSNLFLMEPLSYLEFNYLVERAKVVITDSGGVTEETTMFNIPCLTLRNNTERPETIELGTNELVSDDLETLASFLKTILEGNWKKSKIPPKWDGKSGERIVKILTDISSV